MTGAKIRTTKQKLRELKRLENEYDNNSYRMRLAKERAYEKYNQNNMMYQNKLRYMKMVYRKKRDEISEEKTRD